MKTVNSQLFLLSLSLFLINPSIMLASNAHDWNSSRQYSGDYAYGTNMGYYGGNLKDQDIADLAYNAGARTIRVSLPDWLITGYGINSRIDAFQHYKNLGMKDITAFVGEPNTGTNGASGNDNRETIQFPGASERAKTFKGIYEPVWLDANKTQVNPANTFADYLHKTVKTYGSYVKFWEVVNEPDFTYSPHGWQDKNSDPKSWWNVNPSPEDLPNLGAPIQYYIRQLRVAYDVIKTLNPDSYVAVGGIGYPSFLDALMRNTDNPVDGSVSAQYPLKAGAYFDVLSFHTYPMYNLHKWDNAKGGFVHSRHSDAALDAHFKYQTEYAEILAKYGYNGSTHPQKKWIVTETDLPQATVGTDWGGVTESNNYLMKMHIMSQANNILQTYKYGLGQNGQSTDVFNRMGLYGDISPSSTTVSNAPKTEQYKAQKTLSELLYGKKYDPIKTSQMNLPSTIRGGAFKGTDGRYTYALWAKTNTDLVESASALYTFPFNFNGSRREWDYSATRTEVTSGNTVTLSSSPSFFVENNTTNANPIVTPNIPYTPYIAPMQPAQILNTSTQYYTQPSIQNNQPSITTSFPANTNNRTQAITQINKKTNIVVTASRLNVRQSPNGRALYVVQRGSEGWVVESRMHQRNVWYRVLFDDMKTSGWIHGRYARLK
jgi:hypothetical protein